MKADIIRRAEELSGDEEDVDNPPERERAVPFFQDDLEDETLTDKGVKVAGDGEASDETDGEDETAEVCLTTFYKRDLAVQLRRDRAIDTLARDHS
jgi:hypothetical protein